MVPLSAMLISLLRFFRIWFRLWLKSAWRSALRSVKLGLPTATWILVLFLMPLPFGAVVWRNWALPFRLTTTLSKTCSWKETCDPFSISTCLDQFDNAVHLCLESITDLALSPSQRLQCSLPVAKGGLGLPISSSIAPVAFLGCYLDTKYLWPDLSQHHGALHRVELFVLPRVSKWQRWHSFNGPQSTNETFSLLDSKSWSELTSSASTPRDSQTALVFAPQQSWLAFGSPSEGARVNPSCSRVSVYNLLSTRSSLLNSKSTCPKCSRTLDRFVALLRWQQRALPVPTPGKLLVILCNNCQLSCKKGIPPSSCPGTARESFFSVLCKSDNVFLCIWRHCKFVSVILYLWHFISPRVNAKLLK